MAYMLVERRIEKCVSFSYTLLENYDPAARWFSFLILWCNVKATDISCNGEILERENIAAETKMLTIKQTLFIPSL
jgi:hypothetical protein